MLLVRCHNCYILSHPNCRYHRLCFSVFKHFHVLIPAAPPAFLHKITDPRHAFHNNKLKLWAWDCSQDQILTWNTWNKLLLYLALGLRSGKVLKPWVGWFGWLRLLGWKYYSSRLMEESLRLFPPTYCHRTSAQLRYRLSYVTRFSHHKSSKYLQL